jgi:N-acetyl-anhydromuramyl-L-alanine amidase AmpD
MKIIEFPLAAGLRGNSPRRIIVHCMAEYVEGEDGIVRWAPEHLEHEGYSAHSLCCPNGDEIICRPDNKGAAHAKGFNENTLGIEGLVEGTHNYATFLKAIRTEWVKPAQYETMLARIRKWFQLWPIEQIDRHSDVDPARKKDPGTGFPWERLLSDLGVKAVS